MNTLTTLIKTLADKQASLKNQRKTINLKGVRTISTTEATRNHLYNRNQLRELYAVLGLLRGRALEQIELRAKTPLNVRNVNELKEKYEHEFRRDDTGESNG